MLFKYVGSWASIQEQIGPATSRPQKVEAGEEKIGEEKIVKRAKERRWVSHNCCWLRAEAPRRGEGENCFCFLSHEATVPEAWAISSVVRQRRFSRIWRQINLKAPLREGGHVASLRYTSLVLVLAAKCWVRVYYKVPDQNNFSKFSQEDKEDPITKSLRWIIGTAGLIASH